MEAAAARVAQEAVEAAVESSVSWEVMVVVGSCVSGAERAGSEASDEA